MKKSTKPLSSAELAAYQAHLKKLPNKLAQLTAVCASFKEYCQNPQLHYPKYYLPKLEKRMKVWERVVEDLKDFYP